MRWRCVLWCKIAIHITRKTRRQRFGSRANCWALSPSEQIVAPSPDLVFWCQYQYIHFTFFVQLLIGFISIARVCRNLSGPAARDIVHRPWRGQVRGPRARNLPVAVMRLLSRIAGCVLKCLPHIVRINEEITLNNWKNESLPLITHGRQSNKR